LTYLTGEECDTVHAWSGYAILLLLALRVVWGVIGSRHARFSSFVSSPAAAVAYLRGLLNGSAPRYLGHNPAGGWMALLLIMSLAATGATGVVAYGEQGQGPLAAQFSAAAPALGTPRYRSGDDHRDVDDHDEDETLMLEFHEFLANFSVFLIFLHVAGVAASSLVHRENLVRGMITGRKRAE
ncbi:MAG: cytochrome b/b6 domain-containing protein, partial [Halieaceae bacterium]|nr:cytochrome b/b6 domain-containing protein [Halieaceae bacterium]